VRLNGVIESQYCSSILVPRLARFNVAAQAACVNHYLDPIEMPVSPSTYPYDCSFGCKRCVYVQFQGSTNFYCTAETASVSGCPSPPPSPPEPE